MAQVANPRKQFQFNIVIGGMNPFLAQVVKMPDVEYEMVEHGDTNYDVKTAGKKKIGHLTIDKIFSSDLLDTEIRNWGEDIQSSITGGGLLPSEYKRSVLVEQYAPDGSTVIERWELEGVWPNKINGIDFSRKGSENTTQQIEFCVDEMN